MKMKLTLLLLASVFFVSCGMPTIFAPLSPSDYTFTKLPPDEFDSEGNNTNVLGKLLMHLDNSETNYDLLGNSSTKGPSLMFFYAFGGSSASSNQFIDEPSDLIDNFEDEFMTNGYEGKIISNPEKLISIGTNDKKIYLYGVNNNTATNFNAFDQYVLYSKINGNNANLNYFKLTKTNLIPVQDGYTLDLTWDPSVNFESNASTGNKLYAFDGNSFPLKKSYIQSKMDNPNNHEYDFLGNTVPNSLQIHLFAAFFISGPFSNYFWSDLVYLGAIPINLID